MTVLGFLLALLSALLHAAWNVVARRVAGNPGVVYLAIVFAALAAVPFLPSLGSRNDLSTENLSYIAGTGVLLAVYVALLARAYGVQELSYVYPISRGVGLIGTVIVGMLAFQESVTAIGMLGLGIITAGTIRIGFEPKYWRWQSGLLLAVLPGVALVGTYTIGKTLAHTISPMGYSFGMYAVAAIALAPNIFLKHRAQLVDALNHHKLTALFIGVASFASYMALLMGFRTDKAAYLIAVRELSVPLAVIGGVVFLKERLDAPRAISIAAIVVGAVLMKVF